MGVACAHLSLPMHVVHQHGSAGGAEECAGRTTGWMPFGIHPVSHCGCSGVFDYWTVMVPFMFIARCGVQL